MNMLPDDVLVGEVQQVGPTGVKRVMYDAQYSLLRQRCRWIVAMGSSGASPEAPHANIMIYDRNTWGHDQYIDFQSTAEVMHDLHGS